VPMSFVLVRKNTWFTVWTVIIFNSSELRYYSLGLTESLMVFLTLLAVTHFHLETSYPVLSSM
jgi:hypothetical protein